MSFAQNLKLIRKEKGITQENLAEMLEGDGETDHVGIVERCESGIPAY